MVNKRVWLINENSLYTHTGRHTHTHTHAHTRTHTHTHTVHTDMNTSILAGFVVKSAVTALLLSPPEIATTLRV